MWLRLLPRPGGHLLLAVPKRLDERAVGRALVDGVEVGALDVLDDGDLEELLVAVVAHEDGTSARPAFLGGAPAALAGDDLVAALSRGSGRTIRGWMTPGP
jgi:hypothetical protein